MPNNTSPEPGGISDPEAETEEIVVLRDPETNGYAIKRIVAKPGDSVYVKGGQLFVNGNS